MPWARYDDELLMNRKVTALKAHPAGLAALGLHVLANTWSRHQGTAGFIASYVPEQIGGRQGSKLARLLETVGMFDPCDGGWMIHDFDEYTDPNDPDPHRSAAERKREISEKRAAAGSLGGKAKAAKQTASKTMALLEQTSGPEPDPVHLISSSDNTNPEDTGSSAPFATTMDRRRAVAERYALHALREAKKKGPVTNDDGYMKPIRARAMGMPELTRLLNDYPTGDVDILAHALAGRKDSLKYCTPAEAS